MALEINLIKNTNENIPGTLGKYYGRVEYKGTLELNDLAKHMHHHNTAFSKGIITGVLGDMVDCIKELVLLGYVIKIEDLGLFKASIDSNGLTLEPGAKISSGRGPQRTEEELAANPAAQQFAVGAVKLIMQATGETTIDKMNRDASLRFTSKTKALVKSLTGEEATGDGSSEEQGGSSTGSGTEQGGSSQQGGSSEQGGTQGGGTDDNGDDTNGQLP